MKWTDYKHFVGALLKYGSNKSVRNFLFQQKQSVLQALNAFCSWNYTRLSKKWLRFGYYGFFMKR